MTDDGKTDPPFASITRKVSGEWLAQPLAPLTDATGSGLWPTPNAVEELIPTPTAGDAKSAANRTADRANPDSVHHSGTTLTDFVLWPTPTARLGAQRGAQAKRYFDPKRSNDLDDAVAARGTPGQLNPTWVEWLMGFPLGWTDCGASGTRSSRRSRNGSAGESSTTKPSGRSAPHDGRRCT
jgi:hypothetical protein